MLLAQSPAPAADLLVLAFVAGFAVAALIFWPLLRRSQRRSTSHRGGSSVGLRNRSTSASNSNYVPAHPPKSQPPKTQFSSVLPLSDGQSGSGGSYRLDINGAQNSEHRTEHENEQYSGHHSAVGQSEQQAVECDDVVLGPSELFQENHAAGFAKARARIERLRAELDRL